MNIQKELWGKPQDGKEIYKYTITNASGASVQLGSMGAGIVGINVPDKDGKLTNVVLNYKDALSYYKDGPCAGKVPGRYANRICKGHFTLDGKEYSLPINNGCNHLHGGPDGYQNQVWDSRIEGDAVEFMYYSKDGDAGYPGNLKVVAHYEWSEDNDLKLTLTAQCDAPTVINLTNHVYFNLDGFDAALQPISGREGKGLVEDHILKLNASEFLPTDETLIPVGDSEPVAGTPMDFINPKAIGKDLRADYEPIKIGKGYDHCYIIDGYQDGQIQSAAELWSEKSGRKVEVLTTQPGVQVYAGCYLDGSPKGANGCEYHDYDAVAIECQHYPDSPNHADYPTTVLRPGETYEQAIIWAFSVME